MATTALPEIVDDKSPICIPFILERLRAYRREQSEGRHPPERPFVIGLNGVQGVGKTTLVSALCDALRRDQRLHTIVCSLDDFYLRRPDQVALAAAHPDNALVQVRGEPGTHDMDLARAFFGALCAGRPARVPRYDKSAHAGRGDRAPEDEWEQVNGPDQPPVQVAILEGWCVGFRALEPEEVEARWRDSRHGDDDDSTTGPRTTTTTTTLRRHALEHLLFVNEQLRAYDAVATDLLDALVHVDAQDTAWVYDWRLEQEARLRAERGAGMTDDQVVAFVDAYYPAYELFSDRLRAGLFGPGRPGRQLRLVVAKDRKVKQSVVI